MRDCKRIRRCETTLSVVTKGVVVAEPQTAGPYPGDQEATKRPLPSTVARRHPPPTSAQHLSKTPHRPPPIAQDLSPIPHRPSPITHCPSPTDLLSSFFAHAHRPSCFARLSHTVTPHLSPTTDDHPSTITHRLTDHPHPASSTAHRPPLISY